MILSFVVEKNRLLLYQEMGGGKTNVAIGAQPITAVDYAKYLLLYDAFSSRLQ